MKYSSRKTTFQPPPPASPSFKKPQVSNISVPSFARTIADGFAFGTGSSIARNVVNNVMGGVGTSSPSDTTAMETLCESYTKLLNNCFEKNDKDCRDIFEQMIQACNNK